MKNKKQNTQAMPIFEINQIMGWQTQRYSWEIDYNGIFFRLSSNILDLFVFKKCCNFDETLKIFNEIRNPKMYPNFQSSGYLATFNQLTRFERLKQIGNTNTK